MSKNEGEDFACGSLGCTSQGCDYCKECSHAHYFGHGLDKQGTPYYWTFSPIFGPLFTDSKYIDIKIQPDPPSPHWEAFEEWHKKRKQCQRQVRDES